METKTSEISLTFLSVMPDQGSLYESHDQIDTLH